MPINKNDTHARDLWGDIYDATPKSVFATACWHLANLASGVADTPGAAEARFAEELRALIHGHIEPRQADRPHKLALAAAVAKGFDPSDERPRAEDD